MKYIFFGTSEFSAIIFSDLVAGGNKPSLVVCNPDRPAGRKKVLTAPKIKTLAQAAKVEVFQPDNLDAVAAQRLKRENADFFVLASYGKIFSGEILAVPKFGTVGVHVSLLPKYRGAAPMQYAILKGDPETGITLYLMDEKIDRGPILAQSTIHLTSQTFLDLQAESAHAAARILPQTLTDFASGKLQPRVQDENNATYTAKFQREDGFIDPILLKVAMSGESWEAAQEIERKIRALNPEPGTWTLGKAFIDLKIEPEKEVKIIRTRLDDGKLLPEIIQISGKTPQKYFN